MRRMCGAAALMLLTFGSIAACAVEEAEPTGPSSAVRTSKPSLTIDEEPQQESACDPNYGGACVPIASDVDCAGGSGNGPAYVKGPVTVIGSDIYDLDRDGDGVGCDA
jgi:resuscitation-promoting factor RpfB